MSGDFQLEDTLYFRFTTRAFATGIPTVLAGTPLIDIYEDDSTTQVVVAESLTVDFDSVVGLNLITVTATAATGFEAGKSYCAIIEAGTVGGVSVIGEVVAEFTLDMSAAAKDLANATDGLGALKAETATIVADTAELQGDDVPGLIATLDAVVDTVKAETALIVADTGELQSDDVPGLIAALNDLDAAGAGAGVWGLDATSQQTAGTFGAAIGDPAASAETIFNTLVGAAAGANIAVDIIALKAETAAILLDTGTTLNDKIDVIDDFLDTEIAAITAAVITNATGVDIAADIIALKAETVLIVADTSELQGDWVDTGRLDTILDAILVDTAVIGAAGAGLTDLGGMSSGMQAEVNAEVDTALSTTTITQPGQGTPAASPTIATMIAYLYKAWRNHSDQTATEYNLFNDDTTTVDQKRTVSDDGTNADRTEMVTGP